jgi:hypothetical protein
MNKIIENLAFCIVAVIALTVLPTPVFAQERWAAPPEAPKALMRAMPDSPQLVPMPGDDTFERSIKVDNGVYIELCVTQGNVKVNGWNRNEARVFVDHGSRFDFNVRQLNSMSGGPALITVVGVEKKKNKASTSQCIWGDEIEIDVPTNAIINLKGQDITTSVDTVKRVYIQTIGGDISLRNIANGITASAGQGDITVQESGGAMTLDSNTGNILVFEAGPREIGDMFKAKTFSGEIVLQRLDYRQVEVNSISGSVAFDGDVLSGGSYRLTTTKGSIRMSIPLNSSCQVSATYGFGDFSSELPIKTQTEDIRPGPVKNIVGTFGKGGDATLNLMTSNGSIIIKKQ